MNVETVVKRQLHDLIDSGYSEEEIVDWKKSIIGKKESDMGIQNLNDEIHNYTYNRGPKFAVTGYSFNFQDYIFATNHYLPPYLYWDPYYHNQFLRSVWQHLMSSKTRFWIQKGKGMFAHTTIRKNEFATSSVLRDNVSTFVHTSANQIVRQRETMAFAQTSPPGCDSRNTGLPQNSSFLPLAIMASLSSTTPEVVVSP